MNSSPKTCNARSSSALDSAASDKSWNCLNLTPLTSRESLTEVNSSTGPHSQFSSATETESILAGLPWLSCTTKTLEYPFSRAESMSDWKSRLPRFIKSDPGTTALRSLQKVRVRLEGFREVVISKPTTQHLVQRAFNCFTIGGLSLNNSL